MTLFEVIKHVLASWQVIVVTLAIVLYFSIVSYAARRHHRPRPGNKKKTKKKKAKSADAAINPETTESNSGHVDELGIEET
jgi:phosphotransferase system  glucose/maltose/N-acetylglucosamine-specific IIC component